MAQLVERPTSAQITISLLVGSSPASGSVLTARSSEPRTAFGFCVSLSLCPSPPQNFKKNYFNKINKNKIKDKKKNKIK